MLRIRPRARIVLEAATDRVRHNDLMAERLEAAGHPFAPMYATRTRKVKTNRRDARALAEASLLGAYRPAHWLSDPQRHVRGRLVVRDALVRTRTRYISIIRALLRQHGYRVPSGSAEHFVHRVQRLPLPGRLRSVVKRVAYGYTCQVGGKQERQFNAGWTWRLTRAARIRSSRSSA